MFSKYSKAFQHIWAKAFLVLNALMWPISSLHQIPITGGEINTHLFTLGGPVLSTAVTIEMCNSTRVFQASASVLSCKAFFHFSQAHSYNLWQTGLSTGKFHQLRASELHLGSVHSESNVYCFIPWLSIWAGDCDVNGFHAKRSARFNTSNDQKDAGQTTWWTSGTT